MDPVHISEGDLANDLAVIRPAGPVRRKISECIDLRPADSTATIDPDFEKDVAAAIAAGLMLDSTADVAAERQGKSARRLLASPTQPNAEVEEAKRIRIPRSDLRLAQALSNSAALPGLSVIRL